MNIILGPPGTGKTTRLLNLVEDSLERGISPDRIGYFSFTKNAAQEAILRAVIRFGLSEKELPFFRTLHSLAYYCLSLGKNSMMQGKHYKEAADWLKIGGFVEKQLPNGPFIDFGLGDRFLEVIHMARISQRPLREVYNGSETGRKIDWSRVEYVDRGLREYKKDNILFDFTDLLEMFIERDLAPSLDIVFIDEAQDLSPLQWAMVNKIVDKSKQVFIAGDDDQAIYRWAGADVDHFITLAGNVEVLTQSYRMPVSHHALSQNLISRISNRRKKDFQPRSEDGTVSWYRHSEEVDLTRGEWLLLSRTRRGAAQIEQEVRQRGFLYLYDAGQELGTDVINAVKDWEILRDNRVVPAKAVRNVYKYMVINEDVAYGHKTLPDVPDNRLLTIGDLTSDHGLLHKKPWSETLGKISDEDRRYLKSCLRNGEDFKSKPRITISTIHGSKGTEADNVMLLTDGVRKNQGMWRSTSYEEDDEVRVFYVGVTRAKSSLHLIHPMMSRGFNITE